SCGDDGDGEGVAVHVSARVPILGEAGDGGGTPGCPAAGGESERSGRGTARAGGREGGGISRVAGGRHGGCGCRRRRRSAGGAHRGLSCGRARRWVDGAAIEVRGSALTRCRRKVDRASELIGRPVLREWGKVASELTVLGHW